MSDRMKSKDFVARFLLGEDNREGRDLEGDIVIEGNSEDQKLVLEDLDLENADIYGNVRIRNVTFTGTVNFYSAQVHGNIFLENVTVEGDLAMPQNILDLLNKDKQVILRNIVVGGELQFCTP